MKETPVARKKGKRKKRASAGASPTPKVSAPAASTVESAPPATPSKRSPLLLIAGLVVLQLAIPLTYYLRDDPYDERFAWRMFSGVRLHHCTTEAFESRAGEERALRLDHVVHRAWITHLSRNRRSVIRAFLERRCEEDQVEEVRVSNQCTTPAGVRLDAQDYRRDCASGEVEEPEDPLLPSAVQ